MGTQEKAPNQKERRNPQKKKELNEIEASNLPDIEFKIMVIRIVHKWCQSGSLTWISGELGLCSVSITLLKGSHAYNRGLLYN